MKKRTDGRYQYTLTINGKRKFFYGKTYREAILKAEEYKETADITKKTVRQVAEEWQEQHDEQISAYTQVKYVAPTRRIAEYFGDTLISKITPKDVQRFINGYAAKGYSKNTVETARNVLAMICKFAVMQGYTENNPTEYVIMPKGLKQSHRDVASDEDIKKIKVSANETFGLFAYLILFTGLRRGEALALTYEDINRDERYIDVNKSVQWKSNRPEIVNHTKTDAGMRHVVLLKPLADVIPQSKSGYIFCDENGNPLSETMFRHAYKGYCKRTGISCTAHQIRHSYATMLYEAGIDDKDTQTLMGHASITTTRNIYQHIRDAHLSETRNKLDEFVKNAE